MSYWAVISNNEIITDTDLNDAVAAGLFTSSQTIPRTDKCLTKTRATQYILLDISPLTGKTNNQLVKKSDIIGCAQGYTWTPTLDNVTYYTTLSMPAQPPTTLVYLSGRTSTVYSNAGTKFFSSYIGDGSGTYSSAFLTSGYGGSYSGTLWANPSSNTTDGPMNRCAVWPGVSGSTDNPLNTYIGFVQCVTGLTVGATYYVGISADNDFRIRVNGTTKIDTLTGPLSGSTEEFNYWHVYPIVFNTTTATLEVEGYNIGNIAGFGVEIYNNTLAQLTGATAYNQLNVVFSSTSRKGTYVDASDTVGYGYSCPSGYGLYYDTCTATCVTTIYCGESIPTLPTPTPTLTASPTPTATTTATPTPIPFYQIVSYGGPGTNDACYSPWDSFPMLGNTNNFCTLGTLTSSSWVSVPTNNYYVVYNGNVRNVQHTLGNNFAQTTDAGCGACPTSTPTATPTPTPTPTATTTATPTPTPTPTPDPTYNSYFAEIHICGQCEYGNSYNGGLGGYVKFPSNYSAVVGKFYIQSNGFQDYSYKIVNAVSSSLGGTLCSTTPYDDCYIACGQPTTPTATPTPTPTPTPTAAPTSPSYDLYYADEYVCDGGNCVFSQSNVVVALPSGTSPMLYTKYYAPLYFGGFAYKLQNNAYTGPGLILNTNWSVNCGSLACQPT